MTLSLANKFHRVLMYRNEKGKQLLLDACERAIETRNKFAVCVLLLCTRRVGRLVSATCEAKCAKLFGTSFGSFHLILANELVFCVWVRLVSA